MVNGKNKCPRLGETRNGFQKNPLFIATVEIAFFVNSEKLGQQSIILYFSWVFLSICIYIIHVFLPFIYAQSRICLESYDALCDISIDNLPYNNIKLIEYDRYKRV